MEGFREFVERDDRERYSDIEVARIYQDNPAVPVSELMRATGRTVGEFYRALQRCSVKPSRTRTNHHLVLSYSSQGYTVSEIASLTGYTTRNVWYILSRHKLND